MTEQDNVIPLEIKGNVTVYNQSYVNKLNEKLIEAKDIIRQLLLLPYANNEEVNADVTSILDRAEQFIKE